MFCQFMYLNARCSALSQSYNTVYAKGGANNKEALRCIFCRSGRYDEHAHRCDKQYYTETQCYRIDVMTCA